MESTHVLLVLASASQALRGESTLREAGIQGALIPVPRSVSTRCGVCLRVPRRDRDKAKGILEHAGVRISTIHEETP